ncbi:MAG: hypothetical protein H6656_11370 [Ardenticatenaceae bacterium]|nr:hypothetical protein [Ardenticatenaceae bacterium]
MIAGFRPVATHSPSRAKARRIGTWQLQRLRRDRRQRLGDKADAARITYRKLTREVGSILRRPASEDAYSSKLLAIRGFFRRFWFVMLNAMKHPYGRNPT